MRSPLPKTLGRFRRYPPWPFWVALMVCAGIGGRYWVSEGTSKVPHAAEGSSLGRSFVAGEIEVVCVERPDLLVVRQRVPVVGHAELQLLEARLQLLGVEASGDTKKSGIDFTAEFLGSDSPSLELDRRRLDSAGHFLGYVYVDGRLLNEELIRAGFAKADLYPGDNQTMHRSFVKAEKEAKKAERGLWAKTPRIDSSSSR